MPPTPVAVGNHLLASVPRKDRQRIVAGCEPVDLPMGEVLVERGERIRHVYFPTDSFVSLTTAADNGTTLEVGLVGHEGMLGTVAEGVIAELAPGMNTAATRYARATMPKLRVARARMPRRSRCFGEPWQPG